MKILYRIIFRVDEAVPNNNIYPRMILTAQQKDLYEIMKLYPANLEAVSDFWLSFACQSYDNSPYECALICAIAMSSIKKRDSAFKSFADITGTFAALLTVYKILVIYKSKISATSYKSMNSFVQEFTRLYLSHPEDGLTETPNAISWIIGTHCYAKAASTMETKIGRLIWDNDTLVYRNIRLRLVDLRSAVSKKVAEGEQIMSQLCDVNSFLNLPKIPWDSTLDHKLVANTEHKYGRSTFLWTDDIVTDAWSDSTWCSDKLSLVLSSSFRKTIGVGINIANFRHIAIAIYRKFIIATNKSEKFTNGGESDDEDQEVTADEYWDLQAGHKSSTARNVYARLETEHGASSSTVIDFFRSVSENWHNLLFPAFSTVPVNKHSMSLVLEHNRHQRFRRLQDMPAIEMLKVFLPKATFRGNQEPVLRSILAGENNIVQIAATGVGKSLSFLLPAFMSSTGTNVVIVPLIALQNDLEERCRKLHIPSVQWNEMEGFSTETLVFVTPESATTSEFYNYVNFLLAHHLLDRIYIDEYHLLLNNSDKFHPKMDKLKDLICHAGVPPPDAEQLRLRLGIADRLLIFRDKTTWKNLYYQVVWATRHNYISTINSIVDNIKKGRIFIYARSIELGNRIATELGCGHYFSAAVNKKGIYNRWLNAHDLDVNVIIATSALGCGFDIPDISYVIHVGSPVCLSDFAQESGRAGCDGKQANSILIHIDDMYFKMDENMRSYINNQHCRRCDLDRVMDGRIDKTVATMRYIVIYAMQN
jgi:Helicase conserved C-terminal domain/DEAD/DEAH box helicase